MKPKKNILFSFDYELFLGEKSGSVQNCLEVPTNKLIQIFDRFKIKHVVFFVDTTYLIFLQQQAKHSPKSKLDYACIRKQLQNLIQKDHYVFPHIHPHWLDSTYDEKLNMWSLRELRKYRFNAISEQEREKLFHESIQLLKEIIQEVNPNYKLDSYRAGGWCIQPFEDFYPYFKKYGIENDFSVLRGMRNSYSAQYYNFETSPNSTIYRFDKDILTENANGIFKEFSISSKPVSAIEKSLDTLLRKFYWKIGKRSFGDGIGFAEIPTKNEPERKVNLEMISVELLNRVKLPYYKNYLIENDYMHFISHPKMIWQHHLTCFEKFLVFTRANFEVESDFRKMEAV